MEAIYDELPKPIGFMKFAPVKTRGPMFSARNRLRAKGKAAQPSSVSEATLCGEHRVEGSVGIPIQRRGPGE